MRKIAPGKSKPTGYQTEAQQQANAEFKAAWAERLKRGTRPTPYNPESTFVGDEKGGRHGTQAGGTKPPAERKG